MAADVGSLLGLVIAALAQFTFDASGIVLAYVCGLSAVVLWKYLRQMRAARYAEAGTLLLRALACVEDGVEHGLFRENHEAASQSLRASLDHMAEALTFVTGTTCRVCIAETYTTAAAVADGEPEWMARVTDTKKSR